MIEVTEQIDAVQRQVGTRVLEAGEAHTVTLARTYNGSVAELWDVCTNAERIPRWFLPISGELRTGGHYSLTGNASGTIERCDPPFAFAATWEFGESVTWIELRLRPVDDDHTRLELEHIASVDDEKWAEFGPGAVGVGWDLTLVGLELHLGGGDRSEAEAWVQSPDARQFMSQSSERWYGANVAAGADPAGAREAAERTTRAYAP